ncbi:MAG: addiction module protein [Chromatocurvus sp.]
MEAVRFDALALPDVERAALARDLVASLDGLADADVAAAWDVELCRRISELENGQAELLNADEVLDRARKQLMKA